MWDTIAKFYKESRRRGGNWIVEGKQEQLERYRVVEAYVGRLRNKQAEKLRMQVEVIVQV